MHDISNNPNRIDSITRRRFLQVTATAAFAVGASRELRGANNAGTLLKGAKKVPKGTLFFIGQNGQLYMRTGPYLEGDGKFMFGSN